MLSIELPDADTQLIRPLDQCHSITSAALFRRTGFEPFNRCTPQSVQVLTHDPVRVVPQAQNHPQSDVRSPADADTLSYAPLIEKLCILLVYDLDVILKPVTEELRDLDSYP